MPPVTKYYFLCGYFTGLQHQLFARERVAKLFLKFVFTSAPCLCLREVSPLMPARFRFARPEKYRPSCRLPALGMTKDTPSPLDPKFPWQTISTQVHVNSLKSHRMYNSLRIGRCSHCVLATCAHASTTTIDRHVRRLADHDCLDTIHVLLMSPLPVPRHLWRITVPPFEMEAEA